MDPFSGEGELTNLLSAFHQGQYRAVLDLDTAAFSSSNALPARVLKLRAKIALGDASSVLSEPNSNSPDIQAVQALAQDALGKHDLAISQASSLAEKSPENAAVQICCGTVLAANDKIEDALKLLGKHQGNLEAVALTTQIHLHTNNLSAATQTVTAAKRWAQDSLLINLAESWLALRTGPTDTYQSAFYVYEELATAPSTSSPTSLTGQAVAEILLGRLGEAEAALQQASSATNDTSGDSGAQQGGGDAIAQALANELVLANIASRKGEDRLALTARLEKKDARHPLLSDLAEKGELFDRCAAKYAPKVAAS
ncbi:MAG: hypothetical protein Q9227_001505 [Pyrenula ochraceoflavens]